MIIDLKALGPTKYCNFNFNNILIGDPSKFTIEVRVIPMILDEQALFASHELYMGFLNYMLNSNINFEKKKNLATSENINNLLSFLQ